MVERNLEAWQIFSTEYMKRAIVSCEDIHYGLCLPGESELRLLPPLQGRAVLDVGCGGGENCRAMAALGAIVVGLEPATALFDRARQCLSTSPSAKVLPTPWDGKIHAGYGPYDLILFVGSSEYMPLDSVFFSQLKRCTRPGGRVVLARMHPFWTTAFVHETDQEDWRSYFEQGRTDGVVYGGTPFLRFHYGVGEIVHRFAKHGWSLTFLAEPPIVPATRAPFYMNGCYDDPILMSRMSRIPMTLLIGFQLRHAEAK